MSLRINDAVIWQESEGGISLYNTESGEFRTLNATAAEIWVLLEGDGEREPVIEKLSLMFAARNEALAARIRSEVDSFIGAMLEAGLLEESKPRTAAPA